MNIYILVALIIFVIAQFYGSYVKKNILVDILVQYEKNVRPKILRMYYISLIPILSITVLLILNITDVILNNLSLFIIAPLIIDGYATYTCIKSINNSELKNDLIKVKNGTTLLFLSKSILTLIFILTIKDLFG